MRSELHATLSHVVSARISLDALTSHIVLEMRQGHIPTYRGHTWEREQLDLLQDVVVTIEKAFHLLKGLQFPEMMGTRLADIEALPLTKSTLALPHSEPG